MTLIPEQQSVPQIGIKTACLCLAREFLCLTS